MVEKGTGSGICHAIYWYVKANNKNIKSYDKNVESLYLKYWNVNNLYGWAMSQKLHLGSFKWVEGTSQFNEDYIKSYVDDSNIECFLEVNVQYTESLHNHNHDLPCLFAKVEKINK